MSHKIKILCKSVSSMRDDSFLFSDYKMSSSRKHPVIVATGFIILFNVTWYSTNISYTLDVCFKNERSGINRLEVFAPYHSNRTWSRWPCRKCYNKDNRKCPGSVGQASKNSRKLLYCVEWALECSMSAEQRGPWPCCESHRVWR